MLPTLPLVVVEWDDAWADAVATVTEKDVGETHHAEVIVTIGWLLKQDEKGISIACERCGDGSYRGRSFIPHGMVRSVTPFRLTKPKQKKVVETTKATD